MCNKFLTRCRRVESSWEIRWTRKAGNDYLVIVVFHLNASAFRGYYSCSDRNVKFSPWDWFDPYVISLQRNFFFFCSPIISFLCFKHATGIMTLTSTRSNNNQQNCPYLSIRTSTDARLLLLLLLLSFSSRFRKLIRDHSRDCEKIEFWVWLKMSRAMHCCNYVRVCKKYNNKSSNC